VLFDYFFLILAKYCIIIITNNVVVMKKYSQEIRETLDSFGLSRVEQDVYLLLLGLGQTTATPVAGGLGLPLTTVQSLLLRLAKKGMVHTTKRRSRSAYEAKDPGVLKGILEQKLKEVTGIIPMLRELKAETVDPARVRVYTRERMTDIFRHALQSREKIIYEIVSAQELQELLGEKFHFTRRRVAEGVRLLSLRVEEHEIKKYSAKAHVRELREAKFLPKEMVFSASVMIWDDMVAFFAPPSEGLAWTVKSEAMAMMMRQLFALLWSIGRRMETGVE